MGIAPAQIPESVFSIQAVIAVGISIRFLITRGALEVDPKVELEILPLPPLMCIGRVAVSDAGLKLSSTGSFSTPTLDSGGSGDGVKDRPGFFCLFAGEMMAIRRL
jgi:hypothetical protein